MGAVGAVGGIGGGLGSVAASSATSYDAAPAPAPDPTTSYSQGWYNSSAVMDTSGAREGSSVTLRDSDMTRGGVGSIGDDVRRNQQPQAPRGVGDSPLAEVIDMIACTYAANRPS